MEVIKLNDNVVGYIDKPNEFRKYLPNDTLLSFKTVGKKRTLIYPQGRYVIEPTNKVKGVGEGNICVLCSQGTLVNQGGCFTCNVCGSQLRCGL